MSAGPVLTQHARRQAMLAGLQGQSQRASGTKAGATGAAARPQAHALQAGAAALLREAVTSLMEVAPFGLPGGHGLPCMYLEQWLYLHAPLPTCAAPVCKPIVCVCVVA